MNSRHFVHFARLKSDYKSMQKLRGNGITWQALPPYNLPQDVYPAKYRVTYNLLAPTVNGNSRTHILIIDCSAADYPLRAQPGVRFETPLIKHPQIFEDGLISLGGLPLEESLAEICIRLFRFFQYDANLININPQSLASRNFYNWYLANRHQLPFDRSPVPTISSGLTIKQNTNRNGFIIKQRK